MTQTMTAQELGQACVQGLEQLSEQIAKGLSGAQIRKMILPSQMIRLQETLTQADAQAVSYVMRDVAGEAISLAAGGSMGGGAALEALSEAQAQSFVRLRAAGRQFHPTNSQALAHLVSEHRKRLILWVKDGKEPSVGVTSDETPTDLTQIGQLLATPMIRQAAISSFVASAAVIEAGLTFFTSAS